MSFPGLTRESRQKAMSSDWIPTFVGMTFELFTSRSSQGAITVYETSPLYSPTLKTKSLNKQSVLLI